MKTLIRKGQRTFYGDSAFPHGIARSGYFNLRKSQELEEYGDTLEGLATGRVMSDNAEETRFIAEVNEKHSDLYPVRLWQKYLKAVKKLKSRHGFMLSEAKSAAYVPAPDIEIEAPLSDTPLS